VVRRKRPEKWLTNSWCLLHDNAPAHRSVLVEDFLGKNNVTRLKYPPYSPDLGQADFYLLLRVILASKGWRFSDATDTIKNVTEELKRILQNASSNVSTSLKSLAEVCSCTKGLF